VATAQPDPEPLLTVAVPAYNGSAHLAEALRSILAQEGPSFELVVCDDCSDDDSLDVVRAVGGGRARIEQNPQRLGLAGNWNRCVELASTPLVVVFHQDDVMQPGHLAAHAAAMAADRSIGLVASACDVIDERGDVVPDRVIERGGLGPVDRVYEPGQLAELMAGGNPLRCSAVTLRRAVFADTGGFDPSYRYVLDWEFWLRVSRRWRVAWLAQPTVRIRWHHASETHRFKAGTTDLDETTRLLAQLFDVDLRDGPDRGRLRRIADDRLGRAFLNRAHDALRAGQPDLSRHCLRRAIGLSPSVIKTILRDPRLGIQMAAVAAAPRLAGRWFARETPSS
jgi:Glycosyl transferase family 2